MLNDPCQSPILHVGVAGWCGLFEQCEVLLKHNSKLVRLLHCHGAVLDNYVDIYVSITQIECDTAAAKVQSYIFTTIPPAVATQ